MRKIIFASTCFLSLRYFHTTKKRKTQVTQECSKQGFLRENVRKTFVKMTSLE